MSGFSGERSVRPVASAGGRRSRDVADIRVLALLPYPLARVPGQRFRLEQWAPLLRPEGIEVVYAPFLRASEFDALYDRGRTVAKIRAVVRGYCRRLHEIGSLSGFDVAYVYREAALAGTAWLEARIAKRLPVVFDFDDAIYLRATSDANRRFRFLKPRGKVEALCSLARCVTVGNDVLAAFARRQASRVEVLPTTIDTDAYRIAPRAPNPRPVVGWAGSLTTGSYLSDLLPALRRLREAHPFQLRVIGAPVAGDGLEVDCQPWRADTEVDDLRPIDVGLMPMPDNDWTRGKCALKALQYMALGIPPVVSPVGVNATVVQDGVNGFHARSHDEWIDRIARLLRDPGLRNRLGAAARRTVEERYSARVLAPRLAAVFRQVHLEARGGIAG